MSEQENTTTINQEQTENSASIHLLSDSPEDMLIQINRSLTINKYELYSINNNLKIIRFCAIISMFLLVVLTATVVDYFNYLTNL